jgi:hypothetical protein
MKLPSMYYTGLNDILLLHPFDVNIFDRDKKIEIINLDKEDIQCNNTDAIVLITRRYNAMQKGEPTIQKIAGGTTLKYDTREWTAVSADENTEEINLVVDFSSITIKNENEGLFLEEPIASFKNDNGEDKKESFKYKYDKVFALCKNDLKKGEILKIDWKINWKNLVSPHDKDYNPIIPTRKSFKPLFR